MKHDLNLFKIQRLPINCTEKTNFCQEVGISTEDLWIRGEREYNALFFVAMETKCIVHCMMECKETRTSPNTLHPD